MLRETADTITCYCSEPDCPFRLQPRSLHLDRSQSLPVNYYNTSDCEYVSDDEDSYSPSCRFLRTQPTRRGSAPNRRRNVPKALRDRSHSLAVPDKPTIRRGYTSAPVLSSSE